MSKASMITILFLVLHFGSRSQSFKVTVDTVTLNVYSRIGTSITYKDKFYCFYEIDNPKSSLPFKLFYILTSNGAIEHKIEVSEEMNSFYYDLHVRNDSIITKLYWDHSSYFLDTNINSWVKIPEVDDKVYEDERWYVNYLDFGEWGCTTWFRDKKTGKEYEAAFCNPTINKINNIYYVECGRSVYEVQNPSQLRPCTPENYYSVVEKKMSTDHIEGSTFLTGTKTLFKDSNSEFTSNFNIATSFVYNNKLFLLCAEGDKSYIAIIKNGIIVPVKTIGDIIVYNSSTRCKIRDDNSQGLRFRTKSDQLFGFIEIKGNKIKIHYIN